MSTIRYPALIVLACAAIQLASASAQAIDVVVGIKGSVTLDGKPLPIGRIIFFSADDQFVGSKIKNGPFKIDRVQVGKYKVTVESVGIPAKYSSEDASPLVVEVNAGANVFNFDLKSN